MRSLLIAAVALLAAALPAQAAPVYAQKPTLTTDTGLTYSEWLPKDFAARHRDVPLIVFSHGFGGCAQQSGTLTQALADAGYAVLAPNHKDHACERYMNGTLSALWAMITGDGPDVSFGDDDKWNDTTEAGRRNDMEALLNYALSHAPYKDAIDPARIALMGHSLGGYTVLGLAGGWSSWRDPRFKAVLALAPYDAPFLDKQTLGAITVPAMYMTGTKDSYVEPQLVTQGYDMTHHDGTQAPKYLVVLRDADHFAYTELEKTYQQTIASYAVAFFDHALLHKPAPLLEQPASGQVADYRHTS
jgi:predicted dienelactone hydrolase